MAFVKEAGALHDAGSAGVLILHYVGDLMKNFGLVFILVVAAHFSLFAAPDTMAILKRSTPPATDSTSQAGKKTPSVNSRPAAPAGQNKIESAEKKTVIEEEDLLIEEGEVKKSAAKEAAVRDSLAKLQTAVPVRWDTTQAQKPDTQKNVLPAEKVENPTAHKDSLVAAAPVQAEMKPVPQRKG